MKLQHLLCMTAASLSFTCFATNLEPEVIEEINLSSERVLEEVEVEEQRAIKEAQNQKNEENKDQIAEDEHPLEAVSEEEVVNNYGVDMAVAYSTTHRAAMHKIKGSIKGSLELEDGSVWKVISWSADMVGKWAQTDTIVIAPNTNVFTSWSYPYKFINLDTKEVAKAVMSLPPVLTDPNIDLYTHWIETIDYKRGLVTLEDGSFWKIHSSDLLALEHFSRYNKVIVGTNDGWFRGSNPNILILVKNDVYVRGVVVN